MAQSLNYPVMRPVPISTKGKGFWQRLWAWFFAARQWELIEDYALFLPFLGLNLFVPKGFIFDGASIPRVFWWLLSPTGILFIPSLFHDVGYRYGGLVHGLPTGGYSFKQYSKNELDSILAKTTEYVNDMVAPGIMAQWGLWLGGWLAWNKARRVGRSFFVDFSAYDSNCV